MNEYSEKYDSLHSINSRTTRRTVIFILFTLYLADYHSLQHWKMLNSSHFNSLFWQWTDLLLFRSRALYLGWYSISSLFQFPFILLQKKLLLLRSGNLLTSYIVGFYFQSFFQCTYSLLIHSLRGLFYSFRQSCFSSSHFTSSSKEPARYCPVISLSR